MKRARRLAAAAVGADAVAVGGLLPDDKAAFIERLRAEANGKGVAMVGKLEEPVSGSDFAKLIAERLGREPLHLQRLFVRFH